MPVYNADIAAVLNEMADLLEIEGANVFRVRAYRNAALLVESLPRPVADLLAEGQDLTELEGIGEDLAQKIEEIAHTGQLKQLKEIRTRTPSGVADMLKVAGLGPKRVQKLHQLLYVNNLADLKRVTMEKKVRQLEGFGPKIEKKILEELKRLESTQARVLLHVADEVARRLVAFLQKIPGVQHVEVAGSYRRYKETVGDLDILVIGDAGEEIINRFVAFEGIQEVVLQGDTRATVLLHTGLQVDLRVVAEESYGAALFYFTGSKAHNIHMRSLALERGLKINEYGIFRDDERVAGHTETEIYDFFAMPYIAPELREGHGEIEAAQQHALPELITLEDVRGDLQMHTQWSDGHATLEAMAQAAQRLGYEYMAITDHSDDIKVVGGLNADALARQMAAIERLNETLDGMVVLKAIEVDIREDGSLGLPDEILKQLDLTVCSIHSKFSLPREKQTERLIRAMDHPCFNILAHPTGRILGRRAAYDVDMERLMAAALERGCFLEINAHPQRLDLNGVYAKMAKEMGLMLSVSTDAHRPSELAYMCYGVAQARRGWLTAENVLNTRPWAELKLLLKRA